MAGGKVETDPAKLAERCESFMNGTRRLYNGERIKACNGDMWFFELFHHLNDCAAALRRKVVEDRTPLSAPQQDQRGEP